MVMRLIGLLPAAFLGSGCSGGRAPASNWTSTRVTTATIAAARPIVLQARPRKAGAEPAPFSRVFTSYARLAASPVVRLAAGPQEAAMWRTFLRVPLLLLFASLGGCAVYDYDYDDGDWRRYRGQPYAYEVPRYRVYDDGWRSERRYYSTRYYDQRYYPAPRRYDGHRDYRREQYRYPQRHHESRPAHRGERHPGNWQRGGQPQWRGHSPQRWQQHGGQDRPGHQGQQGGTPRWRN